LHAAPQNIKAAAADQLAIRVVQDRIVIGSIRRDNVVRPPTADASVAGKNSGGSVAGCALKVKAELAGIAAAKFAHLLDKSHRRPRS
jgi:hypothetical protein